MTRTETVNGDLFRRLESRIKALEQAVTLLSKIAKVDVSKLLQSEVDDKNSPSNNNGPGIGGNAKSSTFSSSVLPPSETNGSGKAPPRQFSVRKLRIKIRSLQEGDGNKFQSSSTPTPVLPSPPIQPRDQEEVQLETKESSSPHVEQANEEDDPDWIPEPLSPGSDNASEADGQPSENDTEAKSTSASTLTEPSTSSPKSNDDPEVKPLGYECDKCFTTGFKTKHALKRHKRAEHPVHDRIGNGQGWRTCPYCDKKVYAACKFENHLRTHTGERPYLCSQCGFAAKSKETLNSHMKSLHDGSLPTLVCKYCGKEFKGKSNLTIHEKSHEDHGKMCTICNRKYVNLKGHIQTVHERIRKWECHLCDFKFLKKCNLDKHVKNHDNPNRRVKGYHIVRPERLLNRGKKTVLRIFKEEEIPNKIQAETPQNEDEETALLSPTLDAQTEEIGDEDETV